MISPAVQADLASELEGMYATYRPALKRNIHRVDPWTMLLRNRRARLRKLVRHRQTNNLPMGPEPGWVALIRNLLFIEGSATDDTEVIRLALWLGLKAPAAPNAVARVRGIYNRKLLSDGKLIGLTTFEREFLNIMDMDAADETAADRKRRKENNRQRKRRGPAKPKIGKPWLALKMSRATWYRHGKPTACP